MTKKNKKSKTIKLPAVTIFIGDEEVTDKDIKAIILFTTAIEMSTPRMRWANLDFVMSSKRMKKLMGRPLQKKPTT